MAAPGIAIHEVAADSARIIHEVTQAAYAEYEATTPSTALLETPQEVAESMRDHSVRVAAGQLRESGVTVACVRFSVTNKNLEFFRLAVVPDARGRGTADALLRWLEVTAEREGVTSLACSVRMDVARNLRLYARHGFRQAAERWETALDGSPLRVGELVKTLPQPLKGVRAPRCDDQALDVAPA